MALPGLVLIVLLLTHQALTMPFMHSSTHSIDLRPTSLQLVRCFDALAVHDSARAHNVLNFAISSIETNAQRKPISPHRYVNTMQLHIRDCNEVDNNVQNGFVGFFILQTLIADHLKFLMCIEQETELITSLMYSLYEHETALSPDIQLSLLCYAEKKNYALWKEFLNLALEQ